MPDNTAGLDFQAAWNEAQAEVSVPAETSPSAGTEEPAPEAQAEVEQPAVERDEEEGLFTDLVEDSPDDQAPMQSFEVVVNGKTEMVSLEELRAGYMRQADYTQKTQELAEERKDTQVALDLYHSLQTNPTATIQKLWEAQRGGEPLTQVAPAPEPTSDIDALVEAKLNERLANDPRLKALEEQEALAEVNRVFAQLEEVYETTISEKDRGIVLQKAIDVGTTDIGMVFGALMQQKALREKQRDNAIANSTASGYGGEQTIGSKPKAEAKFSSFRDAISDTLDDEGISQAALEAAVSNL